MKSCNFSFKVSSSWKESLSGVREGERRGGKMKHRKIKTKKKKSATSPLRK
jgi:hypothetical protein